jgi:predicted HAD superfamily hydrolase
MPIHNTVKLYSFDIFDTLITRITGNPDGIFYLMQDILLKSSNDIPSSLKDNFYILRSQTESYLRKFLHIQDILFDDIYRVIGMNHQLSNIQINYLKNLEINTELKSIIGIPSNIDQIKSLIHAGKKVVLISDMYHTSDTIRKMLCSINKMFQDISIYVSSEYLKTKNSGDLYKLIHEKEKIEYSEWTHTGDNLVSDVSIPKSLGIHSIQYIYESLKPYESKTINNNVYLQASIGAAKNARLFDCDHNIKMEFGASFSGPIFFPYVSWVLQEAIKKNIKRLYFIARDGYILKKIADIIITYKNYELETYYIYGSRLVWRYPVDNDLSYLLFGDDFCSVQTLADILHVSPEELQEYFPNIKKLVKIFDRSKIKEIIESNNDFVSFISEKYKKEKLLLTRYLKQAINFTSDNFAFVEFHGTGLTQECINHIIGTFYQHPIKTFFFSFINSPFSTRSKIYTFMPNSYGYNFLEPLLRAPHGQTMGYSTPPSTIRDLYKESEVMPIFEKSEINALDTYRYGDYIKGIEFFTKRLAVSLTSLNVSFIHCIQIKEYLNYIFSTPDKELADLIGSIPFTSRIKCDHVEEFVQKLTLLDIVKKVIKTYHTNFESISIARSSSLIKCLYYTLQLIKKSAKEFKNNMRKQFKHL